MKIKGTPIVLPIELIARPPIPIPVTEDILLTIPVGTPKRLKVRVFEDELFTKEIPGILVELVHRGKEIILHLDRDKVETSIWVVVTTDEHQIIMEVEQDG